MDETQAAALRKPFEAQQIGQKPQPFKKDSPKSKCPVCHGYHGMPATHLDYVGHAAVTDRLLQVDPEWSWEPMAYDVGGLPLFDSNRNLWIKLTVCGVTRLGVGDGTSLKECIGDAIRNAAYRFGVALDLWSKENLQADDINLGTAPGSEPVAPQPTRTMSRKPAKSEPEPEPGQLTANAYADGEPDTSPAIVTPSSPGSITKPQLTALQISLKEAGITNRDDGLDYYEATVGRRVESSKDLSQAEASQVIDALKQIVATDAADKPDVEPDPTMADDWAGGQP